MEKYVCGPLISLGAMLVACSAAPMSSDVGGKGGDSGNGGGNEAGHSAGEAGSDGTTAGTSGGSAGIGGQLSGGGSGGNGGTSGAAIDPWIVDTSNWGPCQKVNAPAGVTIGSSPLVTKPVVADHCLPVGSTVSRTMDLLATSTAEHRHRVKILYYGQSITRDADSSPKWFEKVTSTLKQKYPHAQIETEMLAVGGFGATEMLGPSMMDFPAHYPDLVIWHNYGGYTDSEQLLQYWRKATTAEIAIQNWHPKGTDKQLSPTNGEERMSYVYLPDIGKRLGAELVDIRTPWRQRWLAMNTPVSDLVKPDNTHLAQGGSEWMAEFTLASLKHDDKVIVDPLKLVRSYRVGSDIKWDGRKLSLQFDGNRVELLAAPSPATREAAADVTVDGMAPSKFSSAYVHGRPNGAVDADWPWRTAAPSSVEAKSGLVVEEWTLTITQIAYSEPVTCTYNVTGSVTGPDGTGQCQSTFTSNSGRVVIPAKAWGHLLTAKNANYKVTVTPNTKFKWKVVPLHEDKYPPALLMPNNAGAEHWTTVVSNIPNGRHTLELRAMGTETPQISAIRVFRPPLR